jgi:hypothetical protein
MPFVPESSTWNRFLDAADIAERLNAGLTPVPQQNNNNALVLIKNATAGNREMFQVLGIDTLSITPANNPEMLFTGPALSCIDPLSPDHVGRFAVLAQPIAAGELGYAWISGTCWAIINISSADHGFAEIANGDYAALHSGATGSAQILWSEGVGADSKALVRLGNPPYDLDSALKAISGYNASEIQYLRHNDSDVIAWITIGQCPGS